MCVFCAHRGCSAIFLPQGHHSCSRVKSWLADVFVTRMGAQLDHQVRKKPHRAQAEGKTFVWEGSGQCWYQQLQAWKHLGGRMALGMQVRTFWMQCFPHPQQLLTRMELKLGSVDTFPQEHPEQQPRAGAGHGRECQPCPCLPVAAPIGLGSVLLGVLKPQQTTGDKTLPCPDPRGARDVSRGAGTTPLGVSTAVLEHGQ